MFHNRILSGIYRSYVWLIDVSSNLQSLFLFLMRLTWGHRFILAGLPKLANPAATASMFDSLGIHWPLLHAYAVGLFEVVGGACLMVGFASRLFAIPLIVIMAAAYGTAHHHVFEGLKLFFEPSAFAQQAPYPYLVTALLVLIFGPGRLSVDAWIKRRLGMTRY